MDLSSNTAQKLTNINGDISDNTRRDFMFSAMSVAVLGVGASATNALAEPTPMPDSVRFGPPGEQLVQIQPTDYSLAALEINRNINATGDRKGGMNVFVTNNNDTPTTSALFTSYHKGSNTSGFPCGIVTYSTAARLNGASVLSYYASVNSPDSTIPGQEWNSGLTYAGEINYGNRWAEFGLQRDFALGRWCGGLVFAPDVLSGPDGGGISSNFNSQYGIVFGAGRNGGQDRKTWIPILVAQDSIPAGGIAMHTRGSTSGAARPLSILEPALNWVNGIDLRGASFSGEPLIAPRIAISNSGGTTNGKIGTLDAGGDIAIETNSNGAAGGGARKFKFRANGTLQISAPITPSSSSAPGQTGDICWDSNYMYVCVSSNKWKRSALTTW
jgi:hypothetical protein